MGWDITAITLSSIGLLAVVVMLCIALADILEPNTVTRCKDCRKLMLDNHTRPEPMCYRCRHDHRGHLAVSLSRLHMTH
ncbi:MAG TPA: hypothetical protein VGM75_23990 [Pseudonocardiaceae bacterium]|jgi:hypothetical protein